MKYLLVIFLSSCSLFSVTTAAALPATYNQIVILGDSLSDNGNLYNTTLHLIPKSPPYYAGRFSNGPNWADITAEYFSNAHNIHTENYAVGGETVIPHNPIEGFFPYTLKDSLASYYLHTVFSDKSHTLFIIWIGANDYLNGSKQPDKDTSDVVAAIQTAIEGLISNGAKNFLVMNLPDLALTPFGQTESNPENLHALAMLHNSKLAAVTRALQAIHTDVNFHELDVYDIYNKLVSNPDIFNEKYHTHIKEIKTACWKGSYVYKNNVDEEGAIQNNLLRDYAKLQNNKMNANSPDFKAMAHYVAGNPSLKTVYQVSQNYTDGIVSCAHPDDYAFWDHVHPSAAAHTIVGGILIDDINTYFRAE